MQRKLKESITILEFTVFIPFFTSTKSQNELDNFSFLIIYYYQTKF